MGVPASTHSSAGQASQLHADEKPGKPAIAEVAAPVGTHGVICTNSTAVPREVLPGVLTEGEIPSDFEPDVVWLFVCSFVCSLRFGRRGLRTNKQTNKQTNQTVKPNDLHRDREPMLSYCAETGRAWATLAWRSFAPWSRLLVPLFIQ